LICEQRTSQQGSLRADSEPRAARLGAVEVHWESRASRP
jgi:hypothetical protein